MIENRYWSASNRVNSGRAQIELENTAAGLRHRLTSDGKPRTQPMLVARHVNIGRQGEISLAFWPAKSPLPASTLLQFGGQQSAAQIHEHGSDLQNLARVLGDPNRLLITFVVGVDDLDLVSIEGSGRDRNTLRGQYLQLLLLRLLFLNIEIEKADAVAFSQRQRCNHFKGAGAVGKKALGKLNIDRFRLATQA